MSLLLKLEHIVLVSIILVLSIISTALGCEIKEEIKENDYIIYHLSNCSRSLELKDYPDNIKQHFISRIKNIEIYYETTDYKVLKYYFKDSNIKYLLNKVDNDHFHSILVRY